MSYARRFAATGITLLLAACDASSPSGPNEHQSPQFSYDGMGAGAYEYYDQIDAGEPLVPLSVDDFFTNQLPFAILSWGALVRMTGWTSDRNEPIGFVLTAEASTPLGIVWPKFRQEGIWNLSAAGQHYSNLVSTPDWTLGDGDGFIWEPYDIPGHFSCANSPRAQLRVRSKHYAKWRWWIPNHPELRAVGTLLRLKSMNDMKEDDQSGDCRTEATEVVGGGWEVDESNCTLHQEWFWYEDGVVVDHYWDESPITYGHPYYEFCQAS